MRANLLNMQISNTTFETSLYPLDISGNANAMASLFNEWCCRPFVGLHTRVANFPEIIVRIEDDIGFSAKPDLTLVKIDDERNGTVFCVVEAKRPNQLLGLPQNVNDWTERRDAAADAGMEIFTKTQAQQALQQLHGYMVVHGVKYSILTSGELTFFVKRDNKGNMNVTRGFYGAETGRPGVLSTNEAMAAFIYTASRHPDNGKFLPASNSRSAKVRAYYENIKTSFGANMSDRAAEKYKDKVSETALQFMLGLRPPAGNIEELRSNLIEVLPFKEEAYLFMPLPWSKDYRVVTSCVVRIPWVSNKDFNWDVFVKTMPVSKDWTRETYEFQKSVFLNEVKLYLGPLRPLQGKHVPFLVYGGTYHKRIIIATTSSGETATKELILANSSWAIKAIRASLSALHRAGVLHGDIALRNIAIDTNTKTAHLIDFGRSSQDKTTKINKDKEIKELNTLLGFAGHRKRIRDSFK